MKKIIYISLLHIITSAFSLKAQGNETDSIPYIIEMQFTGEIRNSMDSVFNTVLIVNKSDIQNIKTIRIINQEGSIEKLDFISENNKKGIYMDGNRLYINLGEAQWEMLLPEVIMEDDGKNLRYIHKKNKKTLMQEDFQIKKETLKGKPKQSL